MPSSESYDFAMDRDSIINAAARKIQAIRAGQTMSDRMRQDFVQALNAMVKRWQATDVHIWTVREATLFPDPSSPKYFISSAGGAHATEIYVQNEIAVDAVSGASTITVEDDTLFLDGSAIGIILNSGARQWTTISGVPAANVVTLAAVLDDDASAGNIVHTYATRIERPLKIVSARRLGILDSIETPMNDVSRLQYRDLPQKLSIGEPTQFYYDAQLVLGEFFIWPVLQTNTHLINFTYHRPVQDFDTAADTPDLPVEWVDTIIFNLAVVMAPEFEVPSERMVGPGGIETLAKEFLSQLTGFDREIEGYEFGLDLDGH